MNVNTIDEYLELKSKGVKNFEFDVQNAELFSFIMAEKKGSELTLLEKHHINTSNQNYYYTLTSTFPFGKHKLNNIKCVYKCDPEYIDWCLVNADSFCIELNSLNILEGIKPWISEDLNFVKINGEEYVLDIRNFKKDVYGIPYSDKIREVPFKFSALALQENKIKLNKKLNLFTVLRGSNWKILNPVSFNGQTKKVKILTD